MMGLLRYASVLFVLASVPSSAGDDAPIDPEERLIKYLLNSSTYEKSIRPGVIKNGVKLPLNVSVGFAVYRVVASDDRLETLSLLLYIKEEWRDPRLVWNPKDFGNISVVSTAVDTIWAPRSYLPNMLILNKDDKKEQFNALIASQGDDPNGAAVAMVTYALLQERCDFIMSFFPFDRQDCKMCLKGTQYGADQVNYVASIMEGTVVQGGEWDVETVTVSEGMFFTGSACFEITIRRRSLYYVINLFIPTMAICILNTIGLFASIAAADHNELDFATLGQTTLLSLGILLLTVSDQTPKGTGEVSLLGAFFLAMIFQTLSAAIAAVYLKKHYERVEKARIEALPCSGIVTIKSDEKETVKRHGAKVCMAVHLLLIIIVTIIVLGVGYANIVEGEIMPSATMDDD